MSEALLDAPRLDGWDHAVSGKVRELYVPAGESLSTAREVLVLATDRISAFDFSLQPGIPDKGRILTRMSVLWFDLLKDVVPNHVISAEDVPEPVRGRALRCQGLDMLPLECIVRGYLTGSGLADYRGSGSVGGHALPAGLEDGSRLPEPIYTPSTKAEVGGHDENITVAQARELVGEDLGAQAEEASLEVYRRAADFARERGIILADTKLEFGTSRADGSLVLGDEVLTPDSSRFWDADGYRVGQAQPSFDKQFVRDFLTSAESGWDRASGEEPPVLPERIVEATRAKYIDALERLTGERF
ncbi:phosphoribosylaminoimidazolesuccinocarboxamide synthase [Helcobacillus massiliensis]|uniref:phosphoribosylaminoimidazolesuccinocarboxamide synthase n=1 Tax=Helcobacillus TaxID=1161125 RepID=UPI001EF49D87|nr:MULTISPECIES: phosphoribosylaminoimidazolesuccinocarboxamide synthase [Helcobacillus]MCG7426256.1 phosphoribosylaminoimidazolesuccinocarboxamide synthase [Helcobacillus sp. ACRRO]MCT1558122.1 phosphoribosylaminoimidazolesuccinocarboxamide synthase [Helcobacillus massiliensis]MCT2037183.1 phosphoribosylaminoimidazolesuccinocarboxamide synthase [Helcobacillus massiliensis]MCT2332859.1 phosphoribosylaminoimidazolesuccinocarboxamide synthase [Helcobacillus massiliensis]